MFYIFQPSNINMLSMNKLCDMKCNVLFLGKYCLIIVFVTEKIRGVGKSENGLYYLLNEPVEKTLQRIKEQTTNTI